MGTVDDLIYGIEIYDMEIARLRQIENSVLSSVRLVFDLHVKKLIREQDKQKQELAEIRGADSKLSKE